jgi:hypothetical protein
MTHNQRIAVTRDDRHAFSAEAWSEDQRYPAIE